jgi:hypothetical protein
MSSAEAPANRLLSTLRREVVTKDDGRYLVYYSWPAEAALDDTGAEERADAARPEHRPAPPLAPWTSHPAETRDV